MKAITKQLSSSRIAVFTVVLAAILGVFAFSFASQQTAWADDTELNLSEITENGEASNASMKAVYDEETGKITITAKKAMTGNTVTVTLENDDTKSASIGKDGNIAKDDSATITLDKSSSPVKATITTEPQDDPEDSIAIASLTDSEAGTDDSDDGNSGDESNTQDSTTYKVSTSVSPQDSGEIASDDFGSEVAAGTIIAFEAKASDGYEFVDWTVEGATISKGEKTDTSIEITTAASDTKVVANFAKSEEETYKATINETSNGTVDIKGEEVEGSEEKVVEGLKAGETVTLVVTPDKDYDLSSFPAVTDTDGNSVDVTAAEGDGEATATYTFTMPASNVTIDASFKHTGDSSEDESDDPKDEGTETKTTTEAKTFEVVVSKTDAKTGAPLSGAEFELKDADGKVLYTWTTDGSAITYKLDQGKKYVLSETKAPSGYSREKDININYTDGKVMIDQGGKAVELKKNDDGYAALNVKDMSGSGVRSNTTSPKTGDNSTPAIVGGIVVVAAAGVAFAAYRKNKANKEAETSEE